MTPEQKQRIEQIQKKREQQRNRPMLAVEGVAWDDVDFLLSLVKEQEASDETLKLLLLHTENHITELRQVVKDSHLHCRKLASDVFHLADSFRRRLASESYKEGFNRAKIDAVIAIGQTGPPEWVGAFYKPSFIRAVESLSIEKPKE